MRFHSKIVVVIFEVLIGLFLLAALLVFAAGFISYSHPWITRQAAKAIIRSGVDSCSIGSVKTALWKSIALQDIAIVVLTDSGLTYRLRASEVKIRANLPYVLWALKKVDAAPLIKLPASMNILPGSAKAKNGQLTALRKIFTLIVDGTIGGLTLSVSRGSQEILQAVDGSLQIGTESVDTNREIKLLFAMIKVMGEGFDKIAVTASITPEDLISIDRCSAGYCDGVINSQMLVDLEQARITTCNIAVDKVDLAYWYSVHVGIGKVSGSAGLRFKGNNIPFRNLLRSSECRLTIDNCRLSDLPIQQSLSTALFIPSLSSLDFSKVTVDASIDSTDTIRTKIDGNGSQLSINSNGWVNRQGAMQQKLQGTFSKEVARTFPSIVNRTLEVAKNGGRTFRCRLFGTFSDPRFELDKEMLRRAVGNMFEDFKQELMQQYLGR